MVDFITKEEYLGLDEVYDHVIMECEKICMGGYIEAIDYEGIGAGKTYKGQILLLYKAHQLLCLKDAHRYLGISNDKFITLLNMGLSQAQAEGVFFEGLKSMIMDSPFFNKFGMRVMGKEVRFNEHRIKFKCGNSSETISLGLNIFAAVLDEAAFYNESARAAKAMSIHESQDQAEKLYNQIKRRITSRFSLRPDVRPLLALLSSPKHEEDFMNKKIAEVKEYEIKTSYIINLPTWRAKDRNKMKDEVFVFDRNRFYVIPEHELDAYMVDGQAINLRPSAKDARRLRYGDDELDDAFWIIPIDFHDDFIRAPELSARDYGAIATSTIERFFRRPEEIDFCMYDEIENRWKETLEDAILNNPPSDPVFIHVDLGLNKKRTDGSRGDYAGLSVCHFGGYDGMHGGRPIVKFDMIARISAGSRREVDFGEVREFILRMVEKGWKVWKVTYDSWQSYDSVQTLKNAGLECDILSMDTSNEPYETLKAGIYEHRVFMPKNDVLRTELRQLERVATKDKIDHPRIGTKDVADATAGAMFNCVQFYGAKPESRKKKTPTQAD